MNNKTHTLLKNQISTLKQQFHEQAQRHKSLDRNLSILIYILTAVSTILASASGLFELYQTHISLLIVVCTASIGIVTAVQGKRKAEDLWLIELHLFHAFSDLEREFDYQLAKHESDKNTPFKSDYFFNKIQLLLADSKAEWQRTVLEKEKSPTDNTA